MPQRVETTIKQGADATASVTPELQANTVQQPIFYKCDIIVTCDT